MVKNQPSNTGDMGLIPGQVTIILHAMVQLSLPATTRETPCATTAGPCALEPVPHSKRGHCGGKPARHEEEQPPLPQLEKTMTTWCSKTFKNKIKKEKKIFLGKSTNNKWCGRKGPLLRCWLEYTMTQPVRRTVQRPLKS